MDEISPEKRYCKVRKRKTKKSLDKLRQKTQSENKENAPLGGKYALFNKSKKNNEDRSKSNNTNNLKIKSLTKDRMNIKHGFFAKGARSETISRVGLSEEFKARSEGNLNKIIDLANGRPENTFKTTETIKHLRNHSILNRDETIYCKETSLISIADKCNSGNYPDIQIIDIKPKSPIFKSIPQKIMRDNSVCHISPIKFSPNSKKDTTSKNKQLQPAVLKKNCKLPKREIKIQEHYAKMYEEFAKKVPQELKKYLPSKISDNEANLKKFLNDVHSRSSHVENETRNNSFQQNCSTIKSLSVEAENVPVLLNPMQYLKRVNGHNTNHFTNTKRDNIHYYMDSLHQSKKCRAPESAASNSKYMESLTNLYSNSRSLSHNNILVEDMIHSSPEELFIPRDARSLTPQLRWSSYNFSINKAVKSISPKENMRKQRSIYDIIHHDDMFSVHGVEDTPEPVFFPRRVNCD